MSIGHLKVEGNWERRFDEWTGMSFPGDMSELGKRRRIMGSQAYQKSITQSNDKDVPILLETCPKKKRRR